MNSENEVKTDVTNTEPTIVSPTDVVNPEVAPAVSEPTVVTPEVIAPVVDVPVEVPPVETAPVTPVAEETTPATTEPIGDASGDKNAIVNENLKKVEINYTPPSKFKTTMMILFFIFLIAFVIFLPEITSFVNKYKSGQLTYKEEKITTGKLECSLSTNTTNLDKNYELVFRFTDNKLEKTEFSITTRGDSTLDEGTLDELANTCKKLSASAGSMNGVNIRCEYTDGKLVETQVFDLVELDKEALNAAFTEAGGNNPEYEYGQNMDQIERSMNASGYTCARKK